VEWILFAIMWLVPLFLVAPAKRLHGGSRWGWLLLIALTSWIGFIVFSVIADRYSRSHE